MERIRGAHEGVREAETEVEGAEREKVPEGKGSLRRQRERGSVAAENDTIILYEVII